MQAGTAWRSVEYEAHTLPPPPPGDAPIAVQSRVSSRTRAAGRRRGWEGPCVWHRAAAASRDGAAALTRHRTVCPGRARLTRVWDGFAEKWSTLPRLCRSGSRSAWRIPAERCCSLHRSSKTLQQGSRLARQGCLCGLGWVAFHRAERTPGIHPLVFSAPQTLTTPLPCTLNEVSGTLTLDPGQPPQCYIKYSTALNPPRIWWKRASWWWSGSSYHGTVNTNGHEHSAQLTYIRNKHFWKACSKATCLPPPP